MFHKRSTNIPISNQNETKTFEFYPDFVLSKEIISIISTNCSQSTEQKMFFFLHRSNAMKA
jgi:hypothetical protein